MRATIDKLCRKYRNENAHTEHVTALALRLFDAMGLRLRLPATDRPLLEAAARLHDVGYSVNPAQHPAISAQIVRREGLAGFTTAQRALIAEIIPFHAGPITGGSKHARQLGAFLRIADGLDYSHAQDAGIVRIRGNVVTVRCDAFPHNRVRAYLKADLWRDVFKSDIRFIAPARERVRLPADLRRQLWIQWKTMLINLPCDTVEQLHDFRVALRRCRALLRLLPKRMKPLEHSLARIGEVLGPARDADVWIELLRQEGVTGLFLNRELKWRDRQRRVVPRFAAVRRKLNWLLRVELPALKIPAGALGKELKRVRRLAKLRHSQSADDLHELRIALRRARYLAEFTGHDGLARRLRASERPLGRVHDFDNGLARPGVPEVLRRSLCRQRRQKLKKLSKTWPQLAKRLK